MFVDTCLIGDASSVHRSNQIHLDDHHQQDTLKLQRNSNESLSENTTWPYQCLQSIDLLAASDFHFIEYD